MAKKKEDTIRITLTVPAELWAQIKNSGKKSKPKLSGNQVAVLLLDYAMREAMPKIQWIFTKLPQQK